MAELGATRRYTYWSDRNVKRVAEDHGIHLDPTWRIGVRSPSGPVPQIQATREPRRLTFHEIAQKIEAAIGLLAVEDFVTPPQCSFAKGASRVSVAAYERRHGVKAVTLHTRVKASDGTRVELCLFGSLDNCIDLTIEPDAAKWRASSAWDIERFIDERGLKSDPDDDQWMAVEILRVFNMEGMTDRYVFTAPESSDWFAQVYKDVVLDKNRWNLRPGRDLPEPVDRIVIGAPLWVRS
jgi:hypothetical protein